MENEKIVLKIVLTVEAEDENGFWNVVPGGMIFNFPDEAQTKADALVKIWLSRGWPKDKIRINKASFRKKTNMNV